MSRIIIRKDELPNLETEDDSYFIRYRIINNTNGQRSYWSPFFETTPAPFYAQVSGSVVSNGTSISISWDAVSGISQYDVWLRWEAVVPVTAKITGATGNGTIIEYTSNSHPFQNNQEITVSGIYPTEYNIIKGIIVSSSTNKFSVNGTTKLPYVSGGIASLGDWRYHSTVATNSVSSITIPTVSPSYKKVSVKIYASTGDYRRNPNYQIFESYGNTL